MSMVLAKDSRRREKCDQECFVLDASATPSSWQLEVLSFYRGRDVSSPIRAFRLWHRGVFYGLSSDRQAKRVILCGHSFYIYIYFFFLHPWHICMWNPKHVTLILTFENRLETKITQHQGVGCICKGCTESWHHKSNCKAGMWMGCGWEGAEGGGVEVVGDEDGEKGRKEHLSHLMAKDEETEGGAAKDKLENKC